MIAGIGCISVIVNLLVLVPVLFMLQVYDRVLTSGSRETLGFLLLGAAIGMAMYFAFDYLRARLQALAGLYIGECLTPPVTRALLARQAATVGAASPEGLRDIQRLRNCFSTQGLLACFDAAAAGGSKLNSVLMLRQMAALVWGGRPRHRTATPVQL